MQCVESNVQYVQCEMMRTYVTQDDHIVWEAAMFQNYDKNYLNVLFR